MCRNSTLNRSGRSASICVSTTSSSKRITGSLRRWVPGASGGRSCSMGLRSHSSPTSSSVAAWTSILSPPNLRMDWSGCALSCRMWTRSMTSCGRAFRGGAGRGRKYGGVRLADEQQFSVYNFEAADVQSTWRHFELAEIECKRLIDGYWMATKERGDEIVRIGLKGMVDETGRVNPARYPLLAAYDLCLKCSHYFNILDARGAISVTERVGVIARVRTLAVGIAKAWMDQQYPTEKKSEKSGEAPKPAGKERKGKLAPAFT